MVLKRLRARAQSLCSFLGSCAPVARRYTPTGKSTKIFLSTPRSGSSGSLGSRGPVSLHRDISTLLTVYLPRGMAMAMPMYPLKGLPYREHTKWYPRAAKKTCSSPAHFCDTSCRPITAPLAISGSSLANTFASRAGGSRSSGAQCVKYAGSHKDEDSTLYDTMRASCVGPAIAAAAVVENARLWRCRGETKVPPCLRKRDDADGKDDLAEEEEAAAAAAVVTVLAVSAVAE
mmetsp:Transcript_10561/g.25857  ORF Transcript_10561/g.25857 Transcript_10561/m.25857 type:complete len:232 (+) Transcript_10561:624-1319(+)